LIRNASDDMFRLGTRDAMADVVARSAPISGSVTNQSRIDRDAVLRAVESLGPGAAGLVVAADGGSVSGEGPAFEIGYALGRLMAALAAEGLRATEPKPTPTGAKITIVLTAM
jgi:hypothetical protein